MIALEQSCRKPRSDNGRQRSKVRDPTSILRHSCSDLLPCVILNGGNHGFVRPVHNAARFRPTTRQAALRNTPSLPQGPVRIVFRIPQPPSPPGRGRTGPQFSFRLIPFLQAGGAPAFLFLEDGRQGWSEDRRQRSAIGGWT